MISKTLEDGLSQYSIGAKLRALRLQKKMGLVDLGKHTGVSPALLSKIETEKMFPTLPTLLRIAMVFNVGLEFFFSPPESGPVLAVVRREDRQRFPDSPDAEQPAYHFESLDFPVKDRRLNAYLAEFHPMAADKVRRHRHGGVELIYMLGGSLEVAVGKAVHVLGGGRHVLRRVGRPRVPPGREEALQGDRGVLLGVKSSPDHVFIPY